MQQMMAVFLMLMALIYVPFNTA